MSAWFTPHRTRLTAATVAALSLAAALPGCTTLMSLQPLYGDDEAVTEPRLVGTWTTEGGTLTVSADGAGYDVQFADTSREANQGERLKVRLVNLHGTLYADMVDAAAACGICVPAHLISVVSIDGDDLRLYPLDSDCFADRARQQKLPVTRTRSPDAVILLAETPELRKFLADVAGDCVSALEPLTLARRHDSIP